MIPAGFMWRFLCSCVFDEANEQKYADDISKHGDNGLSEYTGLRCIEEEERENVNEVDRS